MKEGSNKKLLEQISRSKIYQDYERAFSETTKLPLSLRPMEVWRMVQHGKKHENPFCALLAESSRSCAACLEIQQKICETNNGEAKTAVCFAGLSDSAVPIRLGDEVIGFLQTGQVALKAKTKSQFRKIANQLLEWGTKVDIQKLEEAYFQSQILNPNQYQAMLKLLEIFAQHLSAVANQLAIQQENSEPPMILKAKQFMQERKSDPISLTEISKFLNVSTYYFCKMFKKATGINFTEYLSRIRIEKAKNLLLNPNLRVSEIAFEVGFQSLTHFNRVFHKVVGQSPTLYRQGLAMNRKPNIISASPKRNKASSC